MTSKLSKIKTDQTTPPPLPAYLRIVLWHVDINRQWCHLGPSLQRRSPYVLIMLGRRRGRRANVYLTLGQCVVFAWLCITPCHPLLLESGAQAGLVTLLREEVLPAFIQNESDKSIPVHQIESSNSSPLCRKREAEHSYCEDCEFVFYFEMLSYMGYFCSFSSPGLQ